MKHGAITSELIMAVASLHDIVEPKVCHTVFVKLKVDAVNHRGNCPLTWHSDR